MKAKLLEISCVDVTHDESAQNEKQIHTHEASAYHGEIAYAPNSYVLGHRRVKVEQHDPNSSNTP